MTKLLGEQRRTFLLEQLMAADGPLTGSALAKLANVSRQIIVSDMTMLKAQDEPIIATSQGYLYLKDRKQPVFTRRIACIHRPEETEAELNLLIGAGVSVQDVTVEHPVYGELTANLFISSLSDAAAFLERIREANAGYLLELTDGYHLHTITASEPAALERALSAMREHGYLLEEQEG